MQKKQCVLIMGQCGHGKTTTVNRLLETKWHTCAYDTGTTLPYIKIYKKRKFGSHQICLDPFIKTRRAKVQLKWEHSDSVCLKMSQDLTESVCWSPSEEQDSQLYLRLEYDSLTFVDLMGIGDSLITNEHYHKVYRSFAEKATQILWVTDATRRGYREDIQTLRFIAKSCPNLERFVVCLNKSDAIALTKGTSPQDVPSEHQLEMLEGKRKDIVTYLQDYVPHVSFEEKDIIPISARSGWNFPQLHDLFFLPNVTTPSTTAKG